VATRPRAIELSSRSSSGRSGIGRNEDPSWCLGGLPTRGCDGQVARSSGSEEPAGSTGSVTSTGRRRGGTSVLRTSSEGPLSLIPMRALLTFLTGSPRLSSTLAGSSRLSPGIDLLAARARPGGALWSGPLVNTGSRFLWSSWCSLWTSTGRVVEDPGELEVRRDSAPEPLVPPSSDPVELLPRTPSGESGIGRRRRSVPPPPACRRGWRWPVTRPSGSEEPAGSTGSVTSTGQAVNRWTPASCRGPAGHHRRALVAHTDEGPSTISAHVRDGPERRRRNQVASGRRLRQCWMSQT
jgi:hypothetical protein